MNKEVNEEDDINKGKDRDDEVMDELWNVAITGEDEMDTNDQIFA